MGWISYFFAQFTFTGFFSRSYIILIRCMSQCHRCFPSVWGVSSVDQLHY